MILSAAPCSSLAEWFYNDEKDNQKNIQTELFLNLNNSNYKENIDSWVNARVITDAALRYFDEEVRLYKLKPETRKQVDAIMMNYLSQHPILEINQKWEIRFVIDDKQEFSKIIDKLTHTLLNGMSPFIRKIAIAFVFWWEANLQSQLDNLDKSVWIMKPKQYKDVVFDYLWWIIKRVVKDVNWKMNVKDYYDEVNRYFPNQNSWIIWKELIDSWMEEEDIRNLEYPF